MAVPKRKAEFLGLRNLDVFIEATAPTSNYFNILECPEVLTQGKSSFLIGGSQYLKSGVDLKVELVNDENDEVIIISPYFAEYIFYIQNFNGKVIVIRSDELWNPNIEQLRKEITNKRLTFFI